MSEIPFSLEIVINSTIQVWQCTLHSLWSCSETASRCDSQITYLSKEMAVWHKICVRWIVIECNFPQKSNFVVPGFIWGLFPTFYFIFTLPQILFKVISLMVGTLSQDHYNDVHLRGISIEKWWTFKYIGNTILTIFLVWQLTQHKRTCECFHDRHESQSGSVWGQRIWLTARITMIFTSICVLLESYWQIISISKITFTKLKVWEKLWVF